MGGGGRCHVLTDDATTLSRFDRSGCCGGA